MVEDLHTGVTSDVNGFYTLPNMKLGTYKVKVSYVGYSPKTYVIKLVGKNVERNIILSEGNELKEVVVNGAFYGQRKALQMQKENMGVTNVVSADQVGKFPDSNIGDALKRINGINVQYDQGEARFGQVRGTSADLTSVTVNGNRMPSAEGDTRNVQLDSDILRMDVLLFVVTGYFCIQRMRHIRHPYIAPAAWKYKRLVPLLILFAFVEWMGSTPKVLQTAFTGGVLHFGTFTTNVLNLVEWMGAIAGCLFCLFWCKVLRQKYTRLLTVGVMAMVCYPVMMYFLIDPGLPLQALYLPTFLRSFGNAIFFCMLTIYLEELMPFQHFFMGLTMAGIIRNGPVSAMCSGLYSFGIRHQMADNMARGLPYDASNLLMISIRQLYGITCLIGIAVLLVFLLWDIQPVRSTLKKMPAWNFVGKLVRKSLKEG